jgi:uncharacterized protein (TIGR03086 family)
MTTLPDLGPAAQELGDLVRGIRDEELDAPTPNADYSLGDLLDHIDGLSVVFTAAATKDLGNTTATPPAPDAAHLADGWRERIPRRLDDLAAAWREPIAWTGMTQAGGVELPGEMAGRIALDEIVIHGWDVARAIGRPYEPDSAALQPVLEFVGELGGPGMEQAREGLFGPEVEVGDDAPLFDRILGITGRDPAWTPDSR